MKRHPLHLIRFLLPLGFLTYAAAANVAALRGGEPFDLAESASVMRGEVAQRFGQIYAEELPHRSVAVALMGAVRYLAAGEGRDGVTVGDDGWLFSDEEMRPATEAQVAQAANHVAAVQDRLTERGAALTVIPLPAKADIARDRGAPAAQARAMAEQYAQFRDALSARGVDSVHTRPALRTLNARAPSFYPSDTHWTVSGAQAVARAVAAAGHIPKGAATFLQRHAPDQAFTGDLVSFVTSDAMAPRIGLKPESVAPFVAEPEDGAAGGIFAADAPEVDTVLVGTSYSADTRWSFAAALKIALGRDLVNRAQIGVGPFQPMQAFLSDMPQPVPDHVLWEIPVRYLAQAPKPAALPD